VPSNNTSSDRREDFARQTVFLFVEVRPHCEEVQGQYRSGETSRNQCSRERRRAPVVLGRHVIGTGATWLSSSAKPALSLLSSMSVNWNARLASGRVCSLGAADPQQTVSSDTHQ
jgi:beta-galactosidase/beta-glucuronidase